MKIRIILADDHHIMRDGLRAILERHENIEVVGEAGNGRTVVDLAARLAPDVVVMDIGMPDLNGVEATRRITNSAPDVKVIALSTYSDKQFILEMLDAGASGYMIKSTASDELLRAIQAVHGNKTYLSPDVAGAVVSTYLDRQGSVQPPVGGVLGPREREVLQLLAEGRTSRQIAQCLDISVNTVDAHRRNIMHKLDMHSIAELTKYAVREGLTSP